MIDSNADIDTIRRQLAVLLVEYKGLLESHQKLALKVYGDLPESPNVLEDVNEFVAENYPEWAK